MSNNWRPGASLEMLKARAALLSRLRAFFMQRGVMEVETPILSRYAGTDPSIESLKTCYTGPGAPSGIELTLNTSPEFPMKRLLAAGSGSIYQISRVFRDGEAGRLHNPEFTMLEWYRPDFDHNRLMDEVADLVRAVIDADLKDEKVSYHDLFLRYCSIDPHNTDIAELSAIAADLGISGIEDLELEDADSWLDLILTHVIEPQLGQGCLTFVYDYPASQASLSKVRNKGDVEVAERFELYISGIEIANGFHELADAEEQQRRFEDDNRKRRENGQQEQPIDINLIAALEAGFPDCAGVALGVDRLMMVIQQLDSIEETMPFTLLRA